MGYDYEICYKKGQDNVVADGLSRIPVAQLLTLSISTINAELLANSKKSWEDDEDLQAILHKLSNGEPVPKYSYSQGLLYRKGKLAVGRDVVPQTQIVQFLHDSALGGHSGVEVTTKRITSPFW